MNYIKKLKYNASFKYKILHNIEFKNSLLVLQSNFAYKRKE